MKPHDTIAQECFKRQYGHMNVHLCENACEVADGCDALVLVTEWSEYRDLDWEALAKRMRYPFLLDGRHALDREKITRAELRYVGIS